MILLELWSLSPGAPSQPLLLPERPDCCLLVTKYEKSRILGQRAKQINSGAYPFVKVPENVIDGYIIAELELKQQRIPFIIRRPLPNGGSEYWKVKDLEDISF